MTDIFFVVQAKSIVNWLDNIPLPSSTAPASLWSHAFINMPNDDPWDWDNARVIQELSTQHRTWVPRSSTGAPESEQFAERLRHHEIDGPCLLTDITDSELKEELGLVKLAHRSYIRYAIAELRLKSVKYTEYIVRHQTLNVNVSALDLNRSLQGFIEQVKSIHGSISGLTTGKALDDAGDDNEEPARKRVRHDSALPDSHVATQSLDFNAALTPSGNMIAVSAADDVPTTNREKKRKRIAPTLITPEVDATRNRELTTAADSIVINRPATPELPPEPGVVFVGDDGRKRMVPLLQSQASLNTGTPYNDAFRQSLAHNVPESSSIEGLKVETNDPMVGYLGKKALPVDDLFFSASADDGSDVEEDAIKDFSFVSKDIPAGRRQYTYHRMKHFLGSGQHYFKRGSRRFIAVKPYPKQLVPLSKGASFILFSVEGAVSKITRELFQDWPEVDNGKDTLVNVNAHLFSFNPAGPDFNLGSSYNNWDPVSALEKYKFLEGGDEILPLYGDSDSDNEYDDATWTEMEQERGSTINGPPRESRRPLLGTHEVENAINQGVAQHFANWKLKKLPKLEKGAWKFWMKSRKRQSKEKQVAAFKMDLSHIANRLEDLQKKIATLPWTSKTQVIKQTSSMEGTIYAREDLLWKISTLLCKKPPEKPNVELAIEHVQPQDDHLGTIIPGQSEELLDSQDSASSDEEGLQDFVLPDEAVEERIDDEDFFYLSADTEDEDNLIADDHSATNSPEPEDPSYLPVTPTGKNREAGPLRAFSESVPVHIKHEAPIGTRSHFPFKVTDNFINLISSSDEAPTNPVTRFDSQRNVSLSYPISANGSIDLTTPEKPKTTLKDIFPPKQHDQNPTKGSLFKTSTNIEESSDDEEPLILQRRQRRSSASYDTGEGDASPSKGLSKRKKKLVENADAREMRERDLARRAEQEARRAILHATLSQLAPGDEEHDKVIVNDGAAAPPYLHLNKHIAQRIKKHQIDGVRFLWHSVIRDDRDVQGCLLAHTMGLGKTMQT